MNLTTTQANIAVAVAYAAAVVLALLGAWVCTLVPVAVGYVVLVASIAGVAAFLVGAVKWIVAHEVD